MSALPPLARWTAAARRRSWIDDALTGAPVVLLAAAAAWRLAGAPLAALIAAVGVAAGLMLAFARARRFDRIWLVRRLDALRPDLEDSTDLLFADGALSPLQALQRRRLEARVASASGPDPRPAWSIRRMLIAWGLAGLALAAIWLWPPAAAMSPAAEGLPPASGVPHLTAFRLRVTPPAYTGLPARDLTALDGRVPAGLAPGLDAALRPAAASGRAGAAGRLGAAPAPRRRRLERRADPRPVLALPRRAFGRARLSGHAAASARRDAGRAATDQHASACP